MAKYNSKKIVIDGITFDSQLESKYYLHLKELKEQGRIEDFELQPTFELLPGFKYNGKSYRAIKYKADFKVTYKDRVEIVDTKGVITKYFAIKKKLFLYNYPDCNLKLLTFVKKFGGWIELEEAERLRKVNK